MGVSDTTERDWEEHFKDINKMIDDIVRAEEQLNELKIYQEHKSNGDITEAVLICHPKMANVLRNVIHDNNIKDIPIIATQLAEEDKIYMCTDKDVVENARKMYGVK